MVQLIEPLVSVQVTPAEPVTDTNVVLAGRLSLTVIPVAVVPLVASLTFVTVIVYVRFVPAVTGRRLPLFLTPTSARPTTVVLSEPAPPPMSGSWVGLVTLTLLVWRPAAVLAGTV